MICKLKGILKEQGRSQTWLCDKVGISKTSMSSIVNGESIPKLMIALRISKAIEVPVDEIWIEDEE